MLKLSSRGFRIAQLLALVAGGGAVMAFFQTSRNREQSGEDPAVWKRTIPRLLEKIAAAKTVFLYEGLPHQAWESAELSQEKQHKKTRQIHGFDFYADPIAVSAADAKLLFSLCSVPSSYDRYRGEKLCGGYHPDWCLVFGSVEVLLCFGCHDARLYSPDEEIYADLQVPQARGAWKQLEKMLKGYRKNRPLTQHYRRN